MMNMQMTCQLRLSQPMHLSMGQMQPLEADIRVMWCWERRVLEGVRASERLPEIRMEKVRRRQEFLKKMAGIVEVRLAGRSGKI